MHCGKKNSVAIFLKWNPIFPGQKACFFRKEILANQILNSKTPLQAKTLSYKIGIDDSMHGEWKTESVRIMSKGCAMKFEQNPDLMEFLCNKTEGALAESSPDKFWGTGISIYIVKMLAYVNHGLVS